MKGSGGKIGNRIEKPTGLDCPERKVVSFELTMKKKQKKNTRGCVCLGVFLQ